MLEDFNSKYESRHESLQNNVDLVRRLFEISKKPDWADLYEITGLKHGRIYLGLDLQEGHRFIFSDILAKMRIIHDLTEGKVDLSRVYALLDIDGEGRGLAIVSEDMSKNGAYEVEDRAPGAKITKILSEIFRDKHGFEYGIDKMVFRIVNKRGKVIRLPVVDFDHVTERRHYDLYKKYRKEYDWNPKFRIHLV
ncbi:hypothetical protein HYT57_01750 [Candidatus Woesearchaeota archaeon]|nr:hypothetical protein [Candidatus Woesearchaeota archaeon]